MNWLRSWWTALHSPVCGHVEEYVNYGGETVGPYYCTRPAGHSQAHSDGRIGWYSA
jgi:hypothetical protein